MIALGDDSWGKKGNTYIVPWCYKRLSTTIYVLESFRSEYPVICYAYSKDEKFLRTATRSEPIDDRRSDQCQYCGGPIECVSGRESFISYAHHRKEDVAQTF